MAFNPFDVFRRNQRILFAILTVFIMFMFTLSFGAGDFFTQFPRWLGNKRGYGEVMAVVNGSKVHASQLDQIRLQRDLANRYMAEAARQAQGNLAKYVQDGLTRMTDERKQVIQEFVSSRPAYVPMMLLYRLQYPGRFGGPVSNEEFEAAREEMLPRMDALLRKIATDPTAKESDKDVATVALYLMSLDVHLGIVPTQWYFTNQPNQSGRDQLDFLLWLDKADALGIVYTNSDVDTLIASEFKGKATADDWQTALNSVKNSQLYTPEALKRALADEFRVRAAQSAILGASYARSPGAMGVGYDAPYDYFEFYKNQTSPARFGMVSVPTDIFLPSIDAKPTESELRKLFESARGIEASPEKPAIGLRKPREVKVEWIEAKGDEPFYKAAAADQIPKLEALAKGSGFLTFPLESGLPLVVAATAATTVSDPLLQAEFQREKERAERDIQEEWYTKAGSLWSTIYAIDSSVVRPQVAAAVIGAEAGSLLTGAPWATAGLVAQEEVAKFDRQDRGATLAALLRPPFNIADVIGAVAGQRARTAQSLTKEVLRPKLIEAVKEEWTKRIAQADLRAFQEEVAKLGAKNDKSEVKTYIEKFVKDRGLKTGTSAAFHNQYTIGEDPGLAPLKAKLDSATGMFSQQIPFGRQFFFEPTQDGRVIESRGLYRPMPYYEASMSQATTEFPAFVWRVEEKAAESARDLNPEVRAKAEAGWKRLRAREKAKEAAEALAKECGSLGADESTIRKNLRDKVEQFRNRFPDPAAKLQVKEIFLEDVAPLVVGQGLHVGRAPVSPFVVPKSADIPFPTAKMGTELLATREKPPSTSVVLVDQPEDHYYVAVLLGQTDKTPSEFATAVYSPLSPSMAFAANGGVAEAVSRRHQEEMKKKARTVAVELLKAEFRVEKESPDLDKKVDSASSD